MKKLSTVVSRYFDAWILNDTWDSGNRFDRERFYRFVKAVARYNRKKAPLSGDIQKLILLRCGKRRVSTALQEAADEYSSLYQTLMEYERTTEFPNAMIERTNILRFYQRLIRESVVIRQGTRKQEKPSDDQINRAMTYVWGKNWRTQLNKEAGHTVLY